jgi:hypothetical protein
MMWAGRQDPHEAFGYLCIFYQPRLKPSQRADGLNRLKADTNNGQSVNEHCSCGLKSLQLPPGRAGGGAVAGGRATSRAGGRDKSRAGVRAAGRGTRVWTIAGQSTQQSRRCAGGIVPRPTLRTECTTWVIRRSENYFMKGEDNIEI